MTEKPRKLNNTIVDGIIKHSIKTFNLDCTETDFREAVMTQCCAEFDCTFYHDTDLCAKSSEFYVRYQLEYGRNKGLYMLHAGEDNYDEYFLYIMNYSNDDEVEEKVISALDASIKVLQRFNDNMTVYLPVKKRCGHKYRKMLIEDLDKFPVIKVEGNLKEVFDKKYDEILVFYDLHDNYYFKNPHEKR